MAYEDESNYYYERNVALGSQLRAAQIIIEDLIHELEEEMECHSHYTDDCACKQYGESVLTRAKLFVENPLTKTEKCANIENDVSKEVERWSAG